MSSPAPIIGVYLSSHGYGHATRTTALLQDLIDRCSVRLRVRASCPRWLWPASLEQHTLDWHDERCDVGVVQSTDLNVDHSATAAALDAWQTGYEERVEAEVRRLEAPLELPALVFSDLAPIAFDVATRLGVPAVGMANFSWDWIYRELGHTDHADQAARAYAGADLLLQLEPGCPMPAFRRRENLGVIGRRSSLARDTVRARLGLGSQEQLIMPGFKSLDPELIALPSRASGIRYVIPGDPVTRADVIPAGGELAFVDLLAAADLVVAKPGYGIIGDAAVAGTPLLYASRAGFPEDPYLESWLMSSGRALKVESDRLAAGDWLDSAQQLLTLPRSDGVSSEGLARGAAKLLEFLS